MFVFVTRAHAQLTVCTCWNVSLVSVHMLNWERAHAQLRACTCWGVSVTSVHMLNWGCTCSTDSVHMRAVTSKMCFNTMSIYRYHCGFLYHHHVTAWSADSDGNASVHDGLDDQIPVGCFLRADDQECLVLGHMLARMHVLGMCLTECMCLGMCLTASMH